MMDTSCVLGMLSMHMAHLLGMWINSINNYKNKCVVSLLVAYDAARPCMSQIVYMVCSQVPDLFGL